MNSAISATSESLETIFIFKVVGPLASGALDPGRFPAPPGGAFLAGSALGAASDGRRVLSTPAARSATRPTDGARPGRQPRTQAWTMMTPLNPWARADLMAWRGERPSRTG